MKIALMAAAAVMCVTGLSASAQNYSQRDPNAYYSQNDPGGYYERGGRYRKMRMQFDRRDYQQGDRRDEQASYYRQGEYEQNCRGGNVAAGTIFGALAGGVLGSAVSRGNGGAVVGGAVLGGILGNTISRDIECDAQPVAFRTYSEDLNGDMGRRYDWNHGESRGYFQPTRDYQRQGLRCRDFTETTYRGDREMTHNGTACRANDGQWRFD